MMNYALEIEHLSKQYGSFRLDDVSLAVPGGTIMGLIGENGAGKSTTIKCIMNMIRRDSGTIRVLGMDNLREERAVKEQIGVVLDECTFHETLRACEVGKVLSRIYRRWDSACFEDYLRKFGLPRDKTIKEYSKGMIMKLSIASALSARPRLLILDEFLAFIQEETHAILISSHITSDLEKVADYVTYLHKGKVAVQGAKDELLDTYGRLVCARSYLAAVDPALLAGKRVSQFGCEALIKDRRAFCRRYPQLTVDPVTLEEIMLFTVKGDASCAD